MKKMRTFALVAVAVMLVCTVSAFAIDAPAFDVTKHLDITWLGWNVNGMLPADDTFAKKLVEERYNVTIHNVPIDTYNEEQMNLVLSTGLEFDVDTACDNTRTLYDQGLLRIFDEETMKTYMPYAYEKLEKYAASSWRLMAYSSDGGMYSVPAVRHSNTHRHGLGVRSDWMEAVGVTEVPTTLDELETLLLKFVTDDPDKNGKDDTYALTKMDYYCDEVFGAYGAAVSGWLSDENGNPVPAVIQPGYKEGLKVLQRWYSEKIFDPECMFETRQTCIAKFLANSIAGYSGNNWAYALGHQNSPVEAAHREGREISMTLIPPVAGPDGLKGTVLGGDPVNESGLCFGRNCSDEKMIRIMQILNDELTNVELYATLYDGERGVDWDFDQDGYAYFIGEHTNELNHSKGLCRYLYTDFWCDDLAYVREQKERAEVCRFTNDWAVIENHPLNSYTTDADIEYAAATDKISEEFFLKAFTGEIDVDAEWDGYVSRWLKAGGQEQINAKKAAWDEQNK